MSFGITAVGWAGLAAAGIGAVGAVSSAKTNAKASAANNAAQLEANQVDPRVQNMLYGPDGGNGGLLGQYQEAMNKPQDWALGYNANMAQKYIDQNVVGDTNAIRNGALQQMQGISAPSMNAAQMDAPLMMGVPMAKSAQINMSGIDGGAATLRGEGMSIKPTAAVGAATVNGPAQDKMDLTGSFNNFINGDPGANPFLTGAIQKGINQSQNAFTRMQDDSTQNMREMILPSVRSGSLLSGQYGGSRQGIAEGRAMGDFATEQQRAISQFGQYNTDAAVSAQAAAYNTDRDRALSATQGLSGQQYGAAIANANNQQSAANSTASNDLATNLANAQLQQQRYLAEKQNGLQAAIAQGGYDQQTNLANQNAILGVGQNNQQTQFGTNTNNMNAMNTAGGANLQSQLTTNQLNSNNLQTGMGNLGGLLGSAVNTAQTQDQYHMNQLNNSMGVLAPYLAKNATPTNLSPVYNNSAAAGLGGALAGAQMGAAVYNGMSTNFGGSGTGNPQLKGASNGYGTGQAAGGGGNFYDGYGWGT